MGLRNTPDRKKKDTLQGSACHVVRMKNNPAETPILKHQCEDSSIESIDQEKLVDQDPWLFLGEDEDFINAAWIRKEEDFYSYKYQLDKFRKDQLARAISGTDWSVTPALGFAGKAVG